MKPRGYVLAGGRSTRMGVDKARVPLRGWPAAVQLAGVLEALGLEVALVRRERDGLPWIHPDGRPVRVVLEPEAPDRHPLFGVAAALRDARGPALIVPCDAVALDAAALEPLLAGPGVARGAQVHPLVAHIPGDRVDRALALARSGGSARALVSDLPVVAIPAEALEDRNAGGGPWPLERLRELLRGHPAAGVERALRGERARQARRGLVDPSDTRYALRPQSGAQR